MMQYAYNVADDDAVSAADAQAVLRLQAAVWALVRARFEEVQKAEGLTQAGLAALLGVPAAQVSLWLGDSRRMTLKAAARLLHALGAQLECRLVIPESEGRLR